MNFVRYGNQLINLDVVTNIKFLEKTTADDESVIVFEFEKGHESVISLKDAAYHSAKSNLIINVGVMDK